jgi:hypothetical protein
MINSDLLRVFQDMVGVSKRIDTDISRYSSTDSSDEDFFIYHFFHRSLLFGKSIILLVDNQFLHEATLVGRNIMEGLFYFQAFRFEIISGLPQKWRLYGLYEDYQMVKEKERLNLLNHFKNELGNEIVEEAQKQYNFRKRFQNWFNLQLRRKLAEKIDRRLREYLGYDIGMVSLYDTLYHDFSQISHWTPRGVVIGELNINAALAVSFQCLYTMSEYINKKYQFGYDKDIQKILAKHYRICSEALRGKLAIKEEGRLQGNKNKHD